jgi:trimeric autotransporter adhesin
LGSTGFVTSGTASTTFVATTTTTYLSVMSVGAVSNAILDNISVKLADADRSVNANGLIVNGTVTRSPVATGADLVAYSGFSASNYLEQPYNSDLDFGTGDFSIMGWIKEAANSAVETILERDSATTAQRFTLAVNASGFLTFTCDDDTTARTATSNRVVDSDVWTHFVALYDGAGDVKIYLNGVLDDTETGSALLTLNNAAAVLRVGLAVDGAEPLTNGSLALLRISATAPSDSQIEKIYNDEKFLFQENAQATLYGASDAVTALAHDDATNLLHVGTSAGRSVFQGLRRVENTTTAVGTAISAANNMVVEE